MNVQTRRDGLRERWIALDGSVRNYVVVRWRGGISWAEDDISQLAYGRHRMAIDCTDDADVWCERVAEAIAIQAVEDLAWPKPVYA